MKNLFWWIIGAIVLLVILGKKSQRSPIIDGRTHPEMLTWIIGSPPPPNISFN